MAKASTNGTGPQLTPAQEFRLLREVGAVKELESSGRVVRWRPVNLTRMLQKGEIPDHLTTYIAARVWSGKPDDTRSDKDKAIEWMEYLDLVAAASLLHPRISETPTGADEIHPDDLLEEEKLEIEQMATNPAQAVRPFRGEQSRIVAALPEGDEVRQATE